MPYKVHAFCGRPHEDGRFSSIPLSSQESISPRMDPEDPRWQTVLISHADVAPNVQVPVAVWGDDIYLGSFSSWFAIPGGRGLASQVEGECPVHIEILGEGYTVEDMVLESWGSWSTHRVRRLLVFDHYGAKIPLIFYKARVTLPDGTQEECELSSTLCEGLAALPPKGSSAVRMNARHIGVPYTWEYSLQVAHSNEGYRYRQNPLSVLRRVLSSGQHEGSVEQWWDRFFDLNFNLVHPDKIDEAGISAAKKKHKANLERLAAEEPVLHTFFLFLHHAKTWEKNRNNTLLAAFLESTGGAYDNLVEGLRSSMTGVFPNVGSDIYSLKDPWLDARREWCLALPGARDKAEEAEAKSDWTKRKGYGNQAEGLGVTSTNYPLLRAAIEAGDIPTSVFHNPDKSPVNMEFAIWERALAQKGWREIVCQIAKDAAGHSTYEKDVTPYLTFLLVNLPRYLKKHTGYKWKVMPTTVQSQWQLEMEEADENGTVKKRSAFTPVADNTTHTVTVPYVAVAISGVRTQWCYSRHYYVFEEGMVDAESQTPVISDLAVGLNGRDDYGLMYFTLTGTATARGYPTFLVIFERLTSETRVHFHRVHPSRKVDGHFRPACTQIEACYQYMAGNIPAADIHAQQGDMIFIKLEHDPIAAKSKVSEPQRVNEFESHRFEPWSDSNAGVILYTSTAKEPRNRLGFIHATEPFAIRHPEHMDVPEMPVGWYDVRRCRSYENNPVSIWSYTVD